MTEPRYAVGDLAELGGVSRRTVRYYVQEGLLPAPLGVGRGNHYGPQHLERLLEVRALQDAGRTLDEIRQAIGPRAARTSNAAPAPAPAAVVPARTLWRHIRLAHGVELQVAHDIRLPPAARLHELAAWCRLHFTDTAQRNEDDHD